MEARDYVRAVADMVLPRECLVCERKLGIHERHLCTKCAAEMPFTHFETMLRNPMADKFNALIQKDIDTKEPFPAEQYALGTALFYYNRDNGYRNIPKALKYDYDLAAGKYFAQILGRKMLEGGLFQGSEGIPPVDAVVPVPLHWARKWKRGYNQAEIIAAELAKAFDIPIYIDVILRHRRTATQTRLSVEEKHKNVQDAFCINPKIPFNARHILLVDDVFTTGATLNACRKVLRKHLPDSVTSIATLAYVGDL